MRDDASGGLVGAMSYTFAYDAQDRLEMTGFAYAQSPTGPVLYASTETYTWACPDA